MSDGISTEVIVTRRARDGWFVYTCDDLPGLFVASQDDRTAFDDLPASIQKLLKLDLGIECRVPHKVTYREFIAKVNLKERAHSAVAERTAALMGGPPEKIIFGVYPTEDAHVQ